MNRTTIARIDATTETTGVERSPVLLLTELDGAILLPPAWMAGKPAVYACLGAEDHPVYVGCSGNVKRRLTAHRHGSKWWTKVFVVEVMFFETVEVMVRFERAAIDTLRPPENRAGITSPHAPYRGCPV